MHCTSYLFQLNDSQWIFISDRCYCFDSRAHVSALANFHLFNFLFFCELQICYALMGNFYVTSLVIAAFRSFRLLIFFFFWDEKKIVEGKFTLVVLIFCIVFPCKNVIRRFVDEFFFCRDLTVTHQKLSEGRINKNSICQKKSWSLNWKKFSRACEILLEFECLFWGLFRCDVIIYLQFCAP